jgi:hypothetical protein
MITPSFVVDDAVPVAPDREFTLIDPVAPIVIRVLLSVLNTNGCASRVPKKVDELVPALPVSDHPVASGEFHFRLTEPPLILDTVNT